MPNVTGEGDGGKIACEWGERDGALVKEARHKNRKRAAGESVGAALNFKGRVDLAGRKRFSYDLTSTCTQNYS